MKGYSKLPAQCFLGSGLRWRLCLARVQMVLQGRRVLRVFHQGSRRVLKGCFLSSDEFHQGSRRVLKGCFLSSDEFHQGSRRVLKGCFFVVR